MVLIGGSPDPLRSGDCELSQVIRKEFSLRSKKSFGFSFLMPNNKHGLMVVNSELFEIREKPVSLSGFGYAQVFKLMQLLMGLLVMAVHSSSLFANAQQSVDGRLVDTKSNLKTENLSGENSNSVEPLGSVTAETLNSGIELYNRGDYREAKRILEIVARKSPYDAATRYYLGLVYQALKQNVMARAQFAWVASTARDANLRKSAARALGTFINPKRAGEAELLRPGADNDYRTLLAAARAEIAAQSNHEKNSELATKVDVAKPAQVEDQAASKDSNSGQFVLSKDGNTLNRGLVEGKNPSSSRSKEEVSQDKVVNKASAISIDDSSKSGGKARKVYFRVFYFYSPENASCQAFEPVYSILAAKFQALDYRKVLFHDKASAEERALAERYKISHIPRLVYTDANGEELFNEDTSLFRERLKDLSGTAKNATK